MNVYLFGATTTTGKAYTNIFKKNHNIKNLKSFSRYSQESTKLNLDKPDLFQINDNEDFIFVSFAPIWKISKLIDYIINEKPEKIRFFKGILACSSSSIHTKKYSFSKFDKKLVENLKNSEELMLKVCKELKIPICIIQPTLIYGNVGIYKDKNINFLKSVLKNLPLLVIPSQSGLRQPIHSYQLAFLFFKKTEELIRCKEYASTIISVGGDLTLSFKEILLLINEENIKSKQRRKCLIFEIPYRIYFFLISPLLLFKPKWFAAFLRLNVNLSGFNRVGELTKNPKKKFPLLEQDFDFLI